MKQIYFLCTGNSARSQMAEGLGNHLGKGQLHCISAGTKPSKLNPLATMVMQEIGIDISGQKSKPIEPILLQSSDWVITLCGDARDTCPVLPLYVKNKHWDLPDPAGATGDLEQQLTIFRQVRDEIKTRILNFLLEEF